MHQSLVILEELQTTPFFQMQQLEPATDSSDINNNEIMVIFHFVIACYQKFCVDRAFHESFRIILLIKNCRLRLP